ncbi:hypothetical protein G6514_008353 [Epicoccum nigrum]|nr:hypothetical protein G6514_008353 [Epicoccum nigrum]
MFSSWNPTVGNACRNLYAMAGKYICISPPGQTTPFALIGTTATPSTPAGSSYTWTPAPDAATSSSNFTTIWDFPTEAIPIATATLAPNGDPTAVRARTSHCAFLGEDTDEWDEGLADDEYHLRSSDLGQECIDAWDPYCYPVTTGPILPSPTDIASSCYPTVSTIIPQGFVKPPAPINLGTSDDCNKWHVVVIGRRNSGADFRLNYKSYGQPVIHICWTPRPYAVRHVSNLHEVAPAETSITTVAEKAGFAKPIDELCSTDKTDEAIQSRFESTVFSIMRTGETFSANDCKTHFNHINDDCLAGKNMGGGGFTDVEISVDASSDAGEASVKKTSEKSNRKGCTSKPGKGKNPGTKTIRGLISNILGRGSSHKPGLPSLSGTYLDEPMKALPGWGNTFFGVRDELTVSPAQLLKIKEEAYKEVTANQPDLTILVAALYVILEGVYNLGTVPHGASMARMKFVAPATAPALWEVLEERSINGPTKSPSLYHSEGAGMWYAY